MFKYTRFLGIFIALALGAAHLMTPSPATAASAAEIDQGVNSSLKKLYKTTPSAKALAEKAKGILVFPSIIKGGFIVGGQYGEGALRKGAKTIGYYNTVSASYGLQIGVQKYGYALFFMTEASLGYLGKSDGWEVGVGPSFVIVDTGTAKTMTTTTAQAEIYAFFFNQKGLMAGLGLQGTKITKIEK
ncbi:MAG: YSC84-related protein [Desulfobacterales bacterium]|nr:YSC84-related protein [Desulfobacterales bacterium]